jgi:hypothetical protein
MIPSSSLERQLRQPARVPTDIHRTRRRPRQRIAITPAMHTITKTTTIPIEDTNNTKQKHNYRNWAATALLHKLDGVLRCLLQ